VPSALCSRLLLTQVVGRPLGPAPAFLPSISSSLQSPPIVLVSSPSSSCPLQRLQPHLRLSLSLSQSNTCHHSSPSHLQLGLRLSDTYLSRQLPPVIDLASPKRLPPSLSLRASTLRFSIVGLRLSGTITWLHNRSRLKPLSLLLFLRCSPKVLGLSK